jgi:multiple sugar transport system substrate-binding protein
MSSKMSRREFLLISGLTGFGALLAACRPAATPTPETKPAEEPEEKVEEVEPEAEPVTEKVTVEWMNWWGAQREELMDTIIERFEEEFPSIHVENQVQPWDNREQRAATSIASGTPPGLLMVTRTEAQKFAVENLIIPIDDYIQVRGHDVYEIFIESEIDAMKFMDKTWSYPLPGSFLDNTMWFYNKNVMEEFGLDPDSPPVTWQDVDSAMQAMTTFSGDMLDTIGMATPHGSFPSHIYCNNGKFYSDDGRELLFNSPEAVETLEWKVALLEMAGGIEVHNAFFEGLDWQKADYPFYTNKLCLQPHNVSAFGHFETHAPEMYDDTSQWGVMLVPHNGNNPDAKSTGISGLSFTWNQVIAAALPANVREAAYEWLEFFTMREEGGGWFLLEQGRPSPVRAFNENPAYYDANPYWDQVREIMEYDIGVPTTPVQTEVADALNRHLEEVWFGMAEPKEALDAAYDEAQPLVDEFWGEA